MKQPTQRYVPVNLLFLYEKPTDFRNRIDINNQAGRNR